ncbi:MAG: (R)-hydratase [Rhodomicrobium sp.]|nr:MAG: (R)-hydratase [Rhodomicrobium sp.]
MINPLTGGYLIEDLEVGMEATYEREVTEALIVAFAEVSGDTNPVHLDEEYAKTTRFKGRIAHGLLTASFLSTILGTKLPGEGSIYLHQDLVFRAPVRIGDVVLAGVKVEKINFHRRVVVLSCYAKVRNRTVLQGEAVMMVPSRDQT